MTTSDKIQLLGIVISALTSIIAIFISVHTLRQNSKMIEDSSRPYIGIYGLSTYICDRYYYIIIKNFGQSIAHVFYTADRSVTTITVEAMDTRPGTITSQ